MDALSLWSQSFEMPNGLDQYQENLIRICRIAQNGLQAETSLTAVKEVWGFFDEDDPSIGDLSSLRSALSRIDRFSLLRNIQNALTTLERSDIPLPSEDKLAKQRRALIRTSKVFEKICRDAINGQYEDAFFSDDPNREKQLYPVLTRLHQSFAKTIRAEGALWMADHAQAANEQKSPTGNQIHRANRLDDEERSTRAQAITATLEKCNVSVSNGVNRLPNQQPLERLIRDYCSPWEHIARQHIDAVLRIMTNFQQSLLVELVGEPVGYAIYSIILEPANESHGRMAHERLTELLEVQKEDPISFNLCYLDTIRDLERSTLSSSQDGKPADKNAKSQTAAVSFDMMKACYEAAMNRFIDNVPTFCLQLPVVRKMPNIFSPSVIENAESSIIADIGDGSDSKYNTKMEAIRDLRMAASALREHMNTYEARNVRSAAKQPYVFGKNDFIQDTPARFEPATTKETSPTTPRIFSTNNTFTSLGGPIPFSPGPGATVSQPSTPQAKIPVAPAPFLNTYPPKAKEKVKEKVSVKTEPLEVVFSASKARESSAGRGWLRGERLSMSPTASTTPSRSIEREFAPGQTDFDFAYRR